MGFRLRKTFPLGNLLRLNLSKSGVSIGIGPPGLNLNIGPRGVRRTVGIPGTGIYYQDTQRWPKADSGVQTREVSSPMRIPATPDGPVSSLARWVLYGLGLVLLLTGLSAFLGSSKPSAPASATSGRASAASPPPGPPPVSAPDRRLTSSEIRELQTLLRRQGFAPGAVDGLDGPRTRKAISALRTTRGVAGTGEPTLSALKLARGH